jgi:archaellum component FlaC
MATKSTEADPQLESQKSRYDIMLDDLKQQMANINAIAKEYETEPSRDSKPAREKVLEKYTGVVITLYSLLLSALINLQYNTLRGMFHSLQTSPLLPTVAADPKRIEEMEDLRKEFENNLNRDVKGKLKCLGTILRSVMNADRRLLVSQEAVQDPT